MRCEVLDHIYSTLIFIWMPRLQHGFTHSAYAVQTTPMARQNSLSWRSPSRKDLSQIQPHDLSRLQSCAWAW